MKEIEVTIPRGSAKRLSVFAAAYEKAMDGYTVTIHDIGGGQDIIIKPKEKEEE